MTMNCNSSDVVVASDEDDFELSTPRLPTHLYPSNSHDLPSLQSLASPRILVTVVQVSFSNPFPPTSRSYSNSHSIRVIQLWDPYTHLATAYAHLIDLHNFVTKPFAVSRKGQLLKQMMSLHKKCYYKHLKPFVTRISEENIDIELTQSSTATVSIRAPLISLEGIEYLLTLPAIKQTVSQCVKQFGEAFRSFVRFTLTSNVRVLNIGPQPIAIVPQQTNSHFKSRAVQTEEAAEDAYGEEDFDVHCIFARRGDHYQVHWCDRDGLPAPLDGEDNVQWKHKSELNNCPEIMRAFTEDHFVCPFLAKYLQVAEEQKKQIQVSQRQDSTKVDRQPTSENQPTNSHADSHMPITDTTNTSPTAVANVHLQELPNQQATHPMETDCADFIPELAVIVSESPQQPDPSPQAEEPASAYMEEEVHISSSSGPHAFHLPPNRRNGANAEVNQLPSVPSCVPSETAMGDPLDGRTIVSIPPSTSAVKCDVKKEVIDLTCDEEME